MKAVPEVSAGRDQRPSRVTLWSLCCKEVAARQSHSDPVRVY